MAIDYDRLLRLRIPDSEQSYTERDVILYALGIGLGLKPTDRDQLAFVYEIGLKTMPTMAVVLAHPGFWARDLDTGINWKKLVHGEQGLSLSRALPVRATIVGQSRVTDVIDKGAGRGALVFYERRLFDKSSGDHLGTVTQTLFCRDDGGFGGAPREQSKPHAIPDRAPDATFEAATSPQGALLYRLSGDMNPLHAEPSIAEAAGYPFPILHGLATFGAAGHALLAAVGGYQPERLTAMNARFTGPAFPGETFRTDVWRDGDSVSFQVRSVERDTLVIGNGLATIG